MPQTMEKSGCGVVIKGIDRDRWVAVSKNAVPLKDGIGVCVLTETLDLVFNKCQCMQKINQCIETIS